MSGTSVVVAIGPFGGKVLDRFEDSLGQAGGRVVTARATTARDVAPAVERQLGFLLEAGSSDSDSTVKRLDIFVVSVAAAGGEDDLRQIACDLGELLSSRYRAMFNLAAPPELRNAALHFVLWVPPLGENELARAALSRLFRLEGWLQHGVTAGNLLSRVWLLPQQTQAGEVKFSGMVASASAFLLAVLGSGMRDHEEVARLLRHPRAEEGRFGFLSVASLDVPEAAVRRYASSRAVYDALQTLLSRVQSRQSISGEEGLGAVASLPHASWANPLAEGSALTGSVRKLAANLSGASAGLPSAVHVGAFDDADRVRQEYASLLRPASVDREMGAVDAERVEEILRGLDQHEAEIVRQIHVSLNTLFKKTLRGGALRTLPQVVVGLRHLVAQLQDRNVRAAGRLDDDSGPPDPHGPEVEAALAALPAPNVLWGGAIAAGLALGFLVFSMVGGPAAAPPGVPILPSTSATPVVQSVGANAPSSLSVGGAPSATFPWAELLPWGVACVVAGVGAGAWGRASSHLVREDLRRLLRLRLDAVLALWAQGGGGRRERQAEDQLELRRHRVRRVALLAIEDALERIRAIQLELGNARDAMREKLEGMSVTPTGDASTDNLAPLGGEADQLHGPLVAWETVARWVRQARRVAGDDEWAGEVLFAGWAETSAAEDVPCADLAVLDAAGQGQVSSLATSSLLSLPEARAAAGVAVTAFVRRAVASLAPPMKPLGEDFEPTGGEPGRTLVLAPRLAQTELTAALVGRGDLLPVWVEVSTPRVVFLYVWEGFHVLEIGRGAGLIQRPGAA